MTSGDVSGDVSGDKTETPEPVISDECVSAMSVVVNALAGLLPDLGDFENPDDFGTCDEHEQAYPLGGTCPKCETPSLTTDRAREYARHWTQVRHMPDVARRLTLTDPEVEQLRAWVRARCLAEGDLGWHGDPRLYLTETIGLALDMDSEDISHAEYLDLAWALIDAAKGWSS